MQQKKCELFINIACIFGVLGILLLFVNVVIGFVLIFAYVGLSIYTMKKYPNEHKFWLEKMQKTKQISSNVEAEKKRNISKYKEYNYSHEQSICNKTSENNINNYLKNNQQELLGKLKIEYVEEYGKEPTFDDFKCSIFSEDENFDFHNDYQTNEHQGEREYFLYKNQWCFFDYDDEELKYTFKIAENKMFNSDCYIEKMSKKTKQLLNFFLENPNKNSFVEADLKNKNSILYTGNYIVCGNCSYSYYSDNKKCPNCGIKTKENI